MTAAGLQLRLDLTRGDFTLAVDLQLPGRGITALFGPSGSGKTSCLRVLAGLDRVPGAQVIVNGTVWQDEVRGLFVPPWKRAVGYVFQEASLFSHRSVRGNLLYGYRRAGRPADVAVDDLIDLLDLRGLLTRMPAGLSGGERQRVAIGRALMTAPRLLLLDEPLSALDLARKAEILPYLEALHRRLSIPAVYVSHAVDEVMRLADHLVVLESGRVQAQGAMPAVLTQVDLPGPSGREPGVVFDAEVVGHDDDDHLSELRFGDGGRLWVPRRRVPVGQRLRARIPARDVSLALSRPAHSSMLNLLPATLIEGVPAVDPPGQRRVRLHCEGIDLLALITERSWRTLALAPGQAVWAQVKAVALLD